MKIVYLNPSGQLGGAERSLLDIMACVHAAEPGWELGLITGSDGPLAARARDLDVRTTVIEFPGAFARLGDSAAGGLAGRARNRASLIAGLGLASAPTLAYARRLRAVMREFAPGIVHTNGFKMHIMGAWTIAPRTPLVWHVRDYVRARPMMSRLMRIHAGRCAVAIANSDSVARDLREACGPGLKVVRIYNAIDLAVFSPQGLALDLDALCALPPAGAGVVRVGLLATFARWKGHEVFLRALASLPADLPVRGYVIGGPIYRSEGSQYSLEELRAAAAQLGLERRVGFTGFVEDPAAALRAIDIAVHASTEPEPFGRAIAEAMACGRAVIAAAVGGASEIFTAGVDALAHPAGDASALAARIAELATDRDLRARLGAAGHRSAELRFSRERQTEELLPIYGALISSAAA